jgi:hypothetical protein
MKMEHNCELCEVELDSENESVQYPGICMKCIEKEPLVVDDEKLPLFS